MIKNRKKIYILIITLAALLVFSVTAVRALIATGDAGISLKNQPTLQTSHASKDEPRHLSIPTIQVNAKVIDVGVNEKGNMDVPHNFTDVGWYMNGTVPGDVGSAVIAGHVDNGLSLPAVFKKLTNLKAGDDIYIQTESGKELHFVVQKKDVYGYKNAPVDQIFNEKTGKILRLITCEGAWVPIDKTAEKRVIITALLKE